MHVTAIEACLSTTLHNMLKHYQDHLGQSTIEGLLGSELMVGHGSFTFQTSFLSMFSEIVKLECAGLNGCLE